MKENGRAKMYQALLFDLDGTLTASGEELQNPFSMH